MENKPYTVINKRGQTVVPALIRKKYAIGEGDRLAWLDDGETIIVVPIPTDAIRALRGRGKGEKLLEILLSSRQEDNFLRP